jgi:formate dehydrogenase major subunit
MQDIGREVFFFPAAALTDKDGSFTNTQGLLEWHHKAVDPPGDCRSELDFVFKLGQRLKGSMRHRRIRKIVPCRI